MNRKEISSRWYYGWNIVVAATIITLITVGMRMGIGPFFLPILEDFAMSRTTLSQIVAIGMLVYGIGMPLAGYMERHLGTRFLLLSGTIIVVISCLWTVGAQSKFGFLLSYGVFLSLGLAMTSPVALTPILARWFVVKRGRALFYLSTGSMAGIAVMNPVFTLLIEKFGWQNTLVIYASIFVILVVPTALWIIREDVPVGADQVKLLDTNGNEQTIDQVENSSSVADLNFSIAQAVKTWPFWQICLGLFACGYSMNLLGSHGVPMLIDHGFSSLVASFAVGLIGLVALPSTIVLGYLSDRLSRKKMLSLIYFVRGVGFIFLVIVATKTQLYIVAAISGAVWSGSIALSSALLTDYYGVRLVGILYGWAYLGHQIAATISSLIGGWGYEAYGTHWLAFGSAAIVLFIGSWISYQLPQNNKLNC